MINRTEWIKYLQVPDKGADDEHPAGAEFLAERMDEAENMLLGSLNSRSIYRIGNRDEIPMEGVSIEKHLEGCDRVAVLAVTTGNGIDELIKRTQIKDMAMAVILDAGASVLAEQVADEAERSMKDEILSRQKNVYFTPRFSPGYGDYPIGYQRQTLNYVDAPRKIGLMLTGDEMMVPQKSITAIIGIADHPVKGRLATCDECLLRKKCGFLKRGEHC